MKIIEVDEELYQYIASHTQSIGESASDILRRLLHLSSSSVSSTALEVTPVVEPEPVPTQTEVKPVEQMEMRLESAVQNQQDLGNDKVLSDQNTLNPILQLLASEAFKQESKGVLRFLSLLTALYQINPTAFANAIASENVQGRTRLYFAQDEKTLLQAGNHTKPKAIPNTPYWVITNNNSGRKMIMLEAVMREMKLPHEVIEEVKNAFVGG
ncbi:replication initiation negative regulator SeqA [Pasteurellaceae bacterium 22721_9_1]